jgi:hypothetical protein
MPKSVGCGAPTLLGIPPRARYHLRSMGAVTELLGALGQGDPHAASRLLPLAYDELRKLAAQRMAQEQPGSGRPANRPGTRRVPASRAGGLACRVLCSPVETIRGWLVVKDLALERWHANLDVQRISGPPDQSARAYPVPSSMRRSMCHRALHLDGSLRKCVRPERAGHFSLRAYVEVTGVPKALIGTHFGVSDRRAPAPAR